MQALIAQLLEAKHDMICQENKNRFTHATINYLLRKGANVSCALHTKRCFPTHANGMCSHNYIYSRCVHIEL